MKRCMCCLLAGMALLLATAAQAQSSKNAVAKTERELIDKILNCMQYQDTITYTTLFPTFDTLWKQIFAYTDTAVNGSATMANLNQNPERIQAFDPAFNPNIVAGLTYVLQKGEDSGVHWANIAFANYEMKKMILTRDLQGYEKIAPIRFQGYVHIRDMVTRKPYIFTITEVQQIQGAWHGGQVINILPAASISEYEEKLVLEEKWRKALKARGITEADLRKQKEEIAVSSEDEDEDEEATGLSKRQVVDRKLFQGKFDNRTPVILYIRYLRGACPQRVCMWEALYKIGNQEKYVRLLVSRKPDGKWEFNEDPTPGGMELELKNGKFTGTWAGGDNQTGYDVTFEEIPLRPAHAAEMDEVINHGLWARDAQVEKKKKGEPADDEDMEYEEDAPPPPTDKRGRRK